MALSRAEVEHKVAQFIERVRQHVPVGFVYVFGGYATDSADDYSDIDVAVVSREFGSNRHEDLVLLSKCRLPDAVEIEALPFSLREHEDMPAGSFLREVQRTGRLVYEG